MVLNFSDTEFDKLRTTRIHGELFHCNRYSTLRTALFARGGSPNFLSGTENWFALETKALTGYERAEYNGETLSPEVMLSMQVLGENLFCGTQ
jgi:hypothetical protein